MILDSCLIIYSILHFRGTVDKKGFGINWHGGLARKIRNVCIDLLRSSYKQKPAEMLR